MSHEKERTDGTSQAISNEHDDVPKRSTFKSLCLVLTCTAAMMSNISNLTSVSIALSTIQRDLDVDQALLEWGISAYSLSSGCLLLLFGRLADLHGRKRVFVLGSLWMLAFTLGCAFVKDFMTLAILRGFQGVGAAATIPASLGILAHAFPPSRARSAAFATFSAGAPLGGILGYLLGAVVTQLSEQTWRSTFYLSTGLVLLCLVGGMLSFDPDGLSEETDQRVDWLGALLVTAGLVLIVFVLAQGESAPQQWATPYIIALLIVGVILVAAFIAWQIYLERILEDTTRPKLNWFPPPLMRPSLWTRARGKMAVIMCIAFLNWSAFISWTYWVQLYYQNYQGLTPILTVVRLLPMTVAGISCNVIIALVVGHVPVVYLMASGTLLTGCASLLFALIDPSATYWAFGFPAAVISVIGADFVFAAGTLFVAKFAEPHEQSVGGAVFQTMTQLGTSVGLTVSTVVFHRVEQRQDQLQAYRAAHWTDFAFGVLGCVFSMAFLRNVGVVGQKKKVKSEGV